MGMTATPPGDCTGNPVTSAPAADINIFEAGSSIAKAQPNEPVAQTMGPQRIDVLGSDGALRL